MITLDNFENFVSYKILMPGEEYYDTDEEEVVQPDVDIKQLLSFINPQELSKFISEYASMNSEFKMALLNYFNS